MAFIVARRRKELGIRLALGAEPSGVLWIVMREVLILLSIGLAVGVPAAIGAGRYVSSQLYGIQPNDPWIAIGDDRAAVGRIYRGGAHSGRQGEPDQPDIGAALRIG